MSKLPMESRPLRLSPEVTRAVEKALAPLSGRTLERAQAAIVRVYQSGQQMPSDRWVETYSSAIAAAVGQKEAST